MKTPTSLPIHINVGEMKCDKKISLQQKVALKLEYKCFSLKNKSVLFLTFRL